MNFNNKLLEYEINKLTNNVFSKKISNLNEANKQEDINGVNINKVEYFDVLTDGVNFWILVDNIKNICTQISINILEQMGYELDTEVVAGENYLKVSDDFLIYVQKNTNKPKYVPKICLLKTMEREGFYEQSKDHQKSVVLVQMVDGRTVEEETYGMSK